MKNFCIVILSHGRPNIKTYDTLKKQRYNGDIKILIDDEDTLKEEYKKNYGDQVIVFCKKDAEKITDTCDLVDHRKAVVFARNYVFKVMKELNYEYFLVLDDDYRNFSYTFNYKLNFATKQLTIKSFDEMISVVCEYLDKNPHILTVAMAQSGDFIGGAQNIDAQFIRCKRKVMNSFFCHVDRKFEFKGRMNEDVNAYVSYGRAGYIMHQINQLRLMQEKTQKNEGGLTDIYLALGTYVKSFYSVIVAPSCVKVTSMGVTNPRIHHKIDWNACTPKILRQTTEKKENFNFVNEYNSFN